MKGALSLRLIPNQQGLVHHSLAPPVGKVMVTLWSPLNIGGTAVSGLVSGVEPCKTMKESESTSVTGPVSSFSESRCGKAPGGMDLAEIGEKLQ